MSESNKLEKVGLLGLAAMSVVILATIAVLAIQAGKISSDVATLVGVIVTGLIAFGKDILQAVRGYAMSAQLGKVTDQLAASAPSTDNAPPAQDVSEAADRVADAAKDEATKVKGD